MEDKIIEIFNNVLGREITEDEKNSENLSKIQGWDSLIHISFVIAIEKEFGVTIEPEEIKKMENGINSIVKIIERKA